MKRKKTIEKHKANWNKRMKHLFDSAKKTWLYFRSPLNGDTHEEEEE